MSNTKTNVNAKPKEKELLSGAKLFRVLLHNDDYTPMDFVVDILVDIFRKSPTDANRIMLHVHFKGVGMCGAYPHEIAETKVSQVHSKARGCGYPLRATLEQI